MSLTSKQRAALRGMANTMEPVFQIGKGEIDETLIKGVDDCIKARELIKLKVLENSEYDAREAPTSCAKPPCRVRAGDWPQVCAVPQKAEGICLCGTAKK